MIPAAATNESVKVDLPFGRVELRDRVDEILTMVDVSYDTHISDVVLPVHKTTELVDCELHHLDEDSVNADWEREKVNRFRRRAI